MIFYNCSVKTLFIVISVSQF